MLIVNFLIQKLTGWRENAASNVFLLIASLFFYAWGEPVYVFLMLFLIVLNWVAGMLLGKAICRKLVLAGTIILNLFILGFFKYSSLLVDLWNRISKRSIEKTEIALPIGISFFTFQALSYVIDLY